MDKFSKETLPVFIASSIAAGVVFSPVPGWVSQILFYFGFNRGYLTTDALTVALAGTIAAYTASWVFYFYRQYIWPAFDFLGSKGGSWIYVLEAVSDDKQQFLPIVVIGSFFVNHSPDCILLEDGHAYYFSDLTPRGDWESQHASLDNGKLKIIATMRTVNPRANDPVRIFDFVMLLARTREKPVVGCEVWRGEFHDLGDRRDVHGRIYAERLERWSFRKSSSVMEILQEKKEMIGACIVRSADQRASADEKLQPA